ncbi:MAG TPA: hypothetical protein DGZ24_00325 [Rhodospirillaceae bacterium]|nr:hypothetical protein [Candidatus Neomarinimicrobiota bacterium]HCX13740.1 hypothetical protein [Rhodospirillaceae bacterium]
MMNDNKGQLALATVALISAGALVTVVVLQYLFGLPPCDLCYLQRVPYLLNLVMSVLGMMPVVALHEKRNILMYCGFLFILSVVFSGYHVGVEELWWAGPDSCSGGGILSMEGLAAALNQSAQPSCQEPAAQLFGISIAGYNFITSAVLAGFCFWGVQLKIWWNKQ